MKICRVCNQEKESSEFYTHNKETGTLRKDCKECTKERNSKNTMPPAYFRELHLKKTYGLTLEEYDLMLEGQGDCCAICKSTDAKGRGRFHVDHCHETGKIRGLLCQPCNTALGLFKDNPYVLEKAIKYLKDTKHG